MAVFKVVGFKKNYKKFLEATSYMTKKRLEMDPKSDKWQLMMRNYNQKVVEPLDNLWQTMNDGEKRQFLPQRTIVRKEGLDDVPF